MEKTLGIASTPVQALWAFPCFLRSGDSAQASGLQSLLPLLFPQAVPHTHRYTYKSVHYCSF